MNARRLILAAGFLTLGVLHPAVPQNAPVAGDPPVELPPFEVPGKFPAGGWVYTRTGHTEFISQLSARQTHVLADDFTVFQDFVRAHYPEAALPTDYPATVVLCNSSDSFHTFAGSAKNFAATLPGSIRFILIDASQVTQIPRSIRYRWLSLAFKAQPAGKYPLWREWATQEILAAMQIMDGKLELGFPPLAPHRQGEKRVSPMGAPAQPAYSPQFNLMPGNLLKFDELFRLARPLSANADSYSGSMEATAFMHMCQFSTRHKKWREPYRKFIARLEIEPYSNELFIDCFGQDTKAMKSLLHDYLFSPSIKYESPRYKF